jgi:hypothetical protein
MADIEAKMTGRYALYDTPDGGIHIAYEIEGTGDTKHIEVPGSVLRMVQMLENGSMSPAKMMRSLMGGMKE